MDDRSREYSQVSDLFLIRVLMDHRYWILSWLVLSCAIAIHWNSRNRPLYTSSLLIYVDDPYVVPEYMTTIDQPPTNTVKRLYYEATSSHILAFLTKKFNLGEHYGVPEDLEYRHERIKDILLDRIEVKILDQRCLKISVNDAHMITAVQMANELFAELYRVDQTRGDKDLRATHLLYDELRKEIESDRTRLMQRTMLALDSLRQVLGGMTGNGISGPEFLGAYMNASSLPYGNSPMGTGRKVRPGRHNLPKIVLMRGPTYDLKKNTLAASMLRVAGITVFSSCCFISLLLAWHYHGRGMLADIRILRNADHALMDPRAGAEKMKEFSGKGRNGAVREHDHPLVH